MRFVGRWLCSFAVGFIAVGFVLMSGWMARSSDEKVKKSQATLFTKQIAPLLQARCLQCHNDKRARGGLNLSTRKHMMAGGDTGQAVILGHADKSLLVKVISGKNPRMPRRGDGLSAKQVDAVRQWINDGAVWPENVKLVASAPSRGSAVTWWSRRKLKRPPIPKLKNTELVRTPIDAFVLAMLEAKGLSPSTEADRLTLLRRLKFDLHGLPPTPEEIDTFLTDQSPLAYERLIDRLLASPLYGERWGRHWLDIVHYADTHGFDKDKLRLWAWLYRDWVISAFNRDMPYDRFVRMQLAGDALDTDSSEGVIATGFVVAGPWDFVGQVELREGTVAKMKTRLLDRDDMVANTMSTFVSTTAHCARCHDHKFDPISQKEYYQLQAVFAGVERGNRTFLDDHAKSQVEQLQRLKKRQLAQRESLEKQIAKLTAPQMGQLEAQEIKLRKELQSLISLRTKKASPTNGWHSRIERKQDVTKWLQVDLGKRIEINRIRLIPARPTDYPDTQGFGFPVRFRVEISNDPKFRRSYVVADHTLKDYPNPQNEPVEFTLPPNQIARYVRVTATKLWLRRKDWIFALAEMQVESNKDNVAIGSRVTSLDSIEAGRWSRRHLVDNCDSRHRLVDLSDPKVAAQIVRRDKLREGIEEVRTGQKRLMRKRVPAPVLKKLAITNALLKTIQRRLQELQKPSKVYAVKPRSPRPIHVLHRGNVAKKQELVGPGALSLIPSYSGELSVKNLKQEGHRRLALANWVVDKHNVLTWRSIVNRVWQYHFGRGLVDSPNDFGKNGSRPTHPKLLDWLAMEFRDNGQSFKKLHKLILMSYVYRQSSQHNEANAKVDADNRYLWRQNRRKLDAESIRDSVLAVSGQLNARMGGLGFKLFHFKNDHSPHYKYGVPDIVNDPKTFRRSVYRFTVRSVGNPFMESLDCADPNISVPKRNKTLTALQALALLNNPFMVKQAEYFAARLKKESEDPQKQIEYAYRLCFARRPSREESQLLMGYARNHGLANMCRLLFNANEFLFVD